MQAPPVNVPVSTTGDPVRSSSLPSQEPARITVVGRLLALGMAILALAVLLVAASLEPAGAGLGTHEQLNLPTCSWITLMDVPCPTCGMTTAFAHAADGDLVASLAAQPLGGLLAVVTAMTLLLSVYVAATGSRLFSALAGLWGRRTGWLLAAVVLGAWAYKVVSYKGIIW